MTVFPYLDELDPDDVRSRLLREPDRGPVVGPVPTSSLAGLARNLHRGSAQGAGREGKANEEEHYEVSKSTERRFPKFGRCKKCW